MLVLQIISFLISWIHCTENKTISENQTILVCEIYCLVQIMCTVFWCACFCHLCRPNYLQSNSRVIKNGRILFHSQAGAYIIFIVWYAWLLFGLLMVYIYSKKTSRNMFWNLIFCTTVLISINFRNGIARDVSEVMKLACDILHLICNIGALWISNRNKNKRINSKYTHKMVIKI